MRAYQADQVEKWSKCHGFERSLESFAPDNHGDEAVKEY
jgi:hypothetical protein